MNFDRFAQLIEQCPDTLSVPLQALWYDRQGNWQRAHVLVQDESDADSAWVHAYLHRKEGDFSNAQYWYRRSGRSPSQVSLEQEWEQIASSLLAKMQL